jgi:hypothetical protein
MVNHELKNEEIIFLSHDNRIEGPTTLLILHMIADTLAHPS